MRAPSVSPWFFRLWVGLILFCQTALAGRLADAFFGLFFEPGPPSVDWLHFIAQKSFHVLLFGGMGALLALRSTPASKAEVFGWCVGLSCFAESLQLFSSNRHPSPWDALLNVTASLGFYAIASAQAGVRDSRQRSVAPPQR